MIWRLYLGGGAHALYGAITLLAHADRHPKNASPPSRERHPRKRLTWRRLLLAVLLASVAGYLARDSCRTWTGPRPYAGHTRLPRRFPNNRPGTITGGWSSCLPRKSRTASNRLGIARRAVPQLLAPGTGTLGSAPLWRIPGGEWSEWDEARFTPINALGQPSNERDA